MDTVGSMQEQMSDVSRDMETIRMTKILEIKNTKAKCRMSLFWVSNACGKFYIKSLMDFIFLNFQKGNPIFFQLN